MVVVVGRRHAEVVLQRLDATAKRTRRGKRALQAPVCALSFPEGSLLSCSHVEDHGVAESAASYFQSQPRRVL